MLAKFGLGLIIDQLKFMRATCCMAKISIFNTSGMSSTLPLAYIFSDSEASQIKYLLIRLDQGTDNAQTGEPQVLKRPRLASGVKERVQKQGDVRLKNHLMPTY